MEPQQILALGIIALIVILCRPRKVKQRGRYVPKDWINAERYKVKRIEKVENN